MKSSRDPRWTRAFFLSFATFLGLNALSWLFPATMQAVMDVVGPPLLLVGFFALIIGLGIIWNEYWQRRFRRP